MINSVMENLDGPRPPSAQPALTSSPPSSAAKATPSAHRRRGRRGWVARSGQWRPGGRGARRARAGRCDPAEVRTPPALAASAGLGQPEWPFRRLHTHAPWPRQKRGESGNFKARGKGVGNRAAVTSRGGGGD